MTFEEHCHTCQHITDGDVKNMMSFDLKNLKISIKQKK